MGRMESQREQIERLEMENGLIMMQLNCRELGEEGEG